MAQEMEDFKRPNHPDFMSTSELAQAMFTGIRHNSLTDDAEIWLLGNIEARVTKAQTQINPRAISQAYEEVFGLLEVVPDSFDMRLHIAQRNKARGG